MAPRLRLTGMVRLTAPPAATADALRKRGVQVVVFNPAGRPPDEGDFLAVMNENVARLECAAGAKACP